MDFETLARVSGASWFARATVHHTAALVKIIERALKVPGFSMVEVLSNCHVHYGRMNELGNAAQMMGDMDRQTRRTTPVLLRRAAWPHRIGAATDVLPVPDPLVLRGVIMERAHGPDFAERYHSGAENTKGAS